MKLIGVTITEMLVLGVLACGLALAGNALRQDHVEITRNYFEKPKVNLPPATNGQTAPPPPDGQNAAPNPGAAPESPVDPQPVAPDVGQHDEPQVNSRHGLLVIGYEQALEIYQDPMYQDNLCIFLDSRSDAAYAEGHVPGAYQLDHYHRDRYLPELLPAARGAERIVIYCEGGDCEDSIFAANDLLEQDIEYDHIVIYEGGIEEWERNGAPLELGGR